MRFGAASAQFFVNSSLAPVLLFRRSSDVHKGIGQHGLSPSRWEALHRYWEAVCREGPCGLVRSVEPWVNWIAPDPAWFLLVGFVLLWGCPVTSLSTWWW